MVSKGVDRKMAEEMAETMAQMVSQQAGKKATPKITDQGLLEMENIQKIDGEYNVALSNGLIAGYQCGGYWHVINANLDLVAAWITMEQVRELSK